MSQHGLTVTGKPMNRNAQASSDGQLPRISHSLRICVGPTCGVNFSSDLLAETEDHPQGDVDVQRCGCLGHCEEGPNMMLNGTVHTDMTPDRLRALVAELPRIAIGMEVTY